MIPGTENSILALRGLQPTEGQNVAQCEAGKVDMSQIMQCLTDAFKISYFILRTMGYH